MTRAWGEVPAPLSSARPSPQSRTTLFKAGDPSEAQPLHRHKPWLDTGPTPGITPSWLPGQPGARTYCTAVPLRRWPCVHTPQRVWTAKKAMELTELQGQHHPSSPQIPRLQAWALLESPRERRRRQSIPALGRRPPARRLDSLGPPCQNHHKLLSPYPPLTLPRRRLGLRESLKTRGLEGPREGPHSPGTDHRPLEICTYGLSQPNSPRTAITARSQHPHPFLVSQHFPTAAL